MTIRKGEEWGSAGSLDPSSPVFDRDADAAASLRAALVTGEPLGELGLTGGDLHRTLGSPRHDEDDLRAGRGMRFPVDVGLLEFDDPDSGPQQLVFLAHLIAAPTRAGTRHGAPRWKGRTVVAMNAAFVGDENLGPRAHPNDGRLDVTDGRLSWRDRRRAAARSPMGAHVPHPGLAERRVRDMQVESDRPMHVELDGRHVGNITTFRIRCLGDALTVVA